MKSANGLRRKRTALKALLPLALALLGIAFAANAATALGAPGPGWELSADTYPTNLVHAKDEVQEVISSEEFKLTFEGVETESIAFGAPASTVRSALEGLSTIGAGNVMVADGNEGAGTYLVTFTGTLGSMKVAELSGSGAFAEVRTSGGSSGTISIALFNIGAGPSSGTITVTDVLPPGVKAKQAGALIEPGEEGQHFGVAPQIIPNVWDCTGNGPGAAPNVLGATEVACTNDPTNLPVFQGGGGMPTFNQLEVLANPQPAIGISVEAEGEASGLSNQVTVAGGGAPAVASATNPITIGTPTSGGIVKADGWLSNADGTIDTQAGSHPYTATLIFDLGTALNEKNEVEFPGGEVRDLQTKVPTGFIGDLHSFPQCTNVKLLHDECPAASMVGQLKALSPAFSSIQKQVFNMVPQPGTPAELAFEYAGVPVYITFSVQTGGDYAIIAHVNPLAQRETYQAMLTLWGVPEESSHNRWRNREGGCTQEEIEKASGVEDVVDYCLVQSSPTIKPFLTLPTSCGAPQQFSFAEFSAWQDPNARSESSFLTHDASGTPTGFTGCEALPFEQEITASLETNKTDSATGLTVDVKPSLGGLESPTGLASADIQSAKVTLPEGLVINPGQAAGLQSCGASESALTTEAERQSGQENDNAPSCQPASKLGTAVIKSPLIEGAPQKQFEGNVYLLPSNPPEVKLLVAASADGVNVKLVGIVRLDETTGRLVTTFEGTPQVPFSDFKLSFEGGAKAALNTPTQCGSYQLGAQFTPWSTPSTPDYLTQAGFGLNEGPNGTACPSGALPFSPSFTAGSSSTEAGGFTSFSMLMQRADGQQRIGSLQFKSPAGLSAMTSTVPLCGEAEANAGTCPAASHIGHAIVTSGAGGTPLVLPQPGKPELPIYLTGPYKGAPFGLSIVTPVQAGPFDLGTIVTRARIEVDPVTAQITVTTDPLPQIVKGVPTDIRSIDAVVDRPGFFFNPTNCTPQQFSGTATAVGGASAHLSSSFTVGACQALKFTPHLTASTSSKTSKANGASLNVKITYPAGAQADISRVDLTIPAILPTRLTTIQKACTEAIFNANPASCPAGSVIASAVVHTPVLKSPLSGPVYFVSHGNAAFPDVEMLLQGEGVTLVVDGKTQITKGVTFSHFETVPDEPFSSFEFTAPEGPHSIFAANGDLCATEIKLPTTLTGQNGAVLTQSTPVAVEGCTNSLKLVSHQVKKRTLTLKVVVPAAGTLTATGKGLAKASGKSKGRSTVTLTLRPTKKHGRLKTKVKLTYTPGKGKKQTKTLTVSFKK